MAAGDLQSTYLERGLWTEESLGWLASTAAGRWGDRPFLRFEDEKYSFDDLSRWVDSVAHALVSAGIGPGDRVLLQGVNSAPWAVAQLAIWRVGAVSAPVVPIYRRHELAAILADVRPVAVFAAATAGERQPAAELDELLREAGLDPRAKVLLDAGEQAGWSAFPGSVDVDGDLPEPASADSCCTILFTSGTTSAPKGVMLSSRAIVSAMHNWQRNLDICGQDVALSGAPLAHIGGLYTGLLLPLSSGARTVLLSGWRPDRAVELIGEERVTYVAGAAIFLQDIVDRYERGGSVGHRLEKFWSSGAPTPASLIRRAESLGVRAGRCYGMTETCGTIAQWRADAPVDDRADAEGPVVYGSEVEIVDESRTPVPAGVLGEIRLRSPQMLIGYTDPDLTAAQIDEAGWFYPGDMGTLSDSGVLVMTGRSKDIINRGGEKFSSQDIEAAIASHDSIAAASVVGLPDDRLGEIVCACVVLRSGTTWSGPRDILAHLEDVGLARPKHPVAWLVVGDFPRTASGKVRKDQLLEIAQTSAERSGSDAA